MKCCSYFFQIITLCIIFIVINTDDPINVHLTNLAGNEYNISIPKQQARISILKLELARELKMHPKYKRILSIYTPDGDILPNGHTILEYELLFSIDTFERFVFVDYILEDKIRKREKILFDETDDWTTNALIIKIGILFGIPYSRHLLYQRNHCIMENELIDFYGESVEFRDFNFKGFIINTMIPNNMAESRNSGEYVEVVSAECLSKGT